MSALRYRTDAEDMLFDIARSDFESRGVVSDAKKTLIVLMAKQFGRSPEEIARVMKLERTQVEQALETVYSPVLSPM